MSTTDRSGRKGGSSGDKKRDSSKKEADPSSRPAPTSPKKKVVDAFWNFRKDFEEGIAGIKAGAKTNTYPAHQQLSATQKQAYKALLERLEELHTAESNEGDTGFARAQMQHFAMQNVNKPIDEAVAAFAKAYPYEPKLNKGKGKSTAQESQSAPAGSVEGLRSKLPPPPPPPTPTSRPGSRAPSRQGSRDNGSVVSRGSSFDDGRPSTVGSDTASFLLSEEAKRHERAAVYPDQRIRDLKLWIEEARPYLGEQFEKRTEYDNLLERYAKAAEALPVDAAINMFASTRLRRYLNEKCLHDTGFTTEKCKIFADHWDNHVLDPETARKKFQREVLGKDAKARSQESGVPRKPNPFAGLRSDSTSSGGS